MTVLLLFQNRIIQESLKHFLSVHFQHTEFAIASKSGFNLGQLNAIAPDIIVVETDFYVNSTVDFIRFIRENNNALPIIAISTQTQDEFAPDLFRNGAHAFIFHWLRADFQPWQGYHADYLVSVFVWIFHAYFLG
jgi:DNA-binding NarL/FixJ family response regulator